MRRETIITLSITVAVGISAFFIDAKLYYYGKSDWAVHNKLPFSVEPEYWGTNRGMLGFVLAEDNETLIGKGNRYWGYPNIEVDEIIKYGFNNERLVTLVNDSLGNTYYVICEKQTDARSKQALKITVVPQQEFISGEQFKWINVKSLSTKRLELARNYLEILLLLLTSIVLYKLLANKQKNAAETLH